MKTLLNATVLGMLMATFGCSAAESDASDSSSEGVTAAPEAPVRAVVEAYMDYRVREEFTAAVGDQAIIGFPNITIPGVLTLQHQYSIAALHLEVSSWVSYRMKEQPDPENQDLMAITFPRYSLGELTMTPDWKASEEAASKLFTAMSRASETITDDHGVTVRTRTSGKGTFSCSERARQTEKSYDCTIEGLSRIGGAGIMWQGFGTGTIKD